MSMEQWPSITAVLRVMAGWFLLGIGLLDLAVEVDGGLSGAYLVFHAMIAMGGVLLLLRRRPSPGPAGYALAAALVAVAIVATLVPHSAGCCMEAYPGRHGYPFPFLGVGGGLHVDPLYLAADLIFWSCAALLAVVALAGVERVLPERRTPVDLSRYNAYAEPSPRGENVGGLT
ncbi:hypothetical protein Aph02nite_54590 [Actinoplanes philippinensis]|uniref:Uncharacterized protein n=1 Tax=Actinoplanes philippinensis TaxID=35752 RepID=A0A1I2J6P1_9ACTN|nr:hypothetical protein [Actinoplanes philippinensis]GIE79509.1 hypothetical protein Aph02nite_54590 [Actinoplanes philippinensis]SFF49688.1 hypothetical protein SAMN05421541_111341 [Actinoplanes philippinensis]